ncbi:hypothetical protein TrRE_jg7812 [Triparma retinervis]|uniref:Uncharacterized protein n=1 Tax=Triparma retinervis TaxID=2557542 RepID=A0A9W6ZIE5_9STRA|nr:hypothetical protein TrRE_jg7812 [Triparma retinervis]
MLAADRRAVDSELQAQAVQIKNMEMQNVDRYLQAIGTQAALICGLSISTQLSDSMIAFTNDEEHWIIQVLHNGFIVSCLCLEFYCVINSTLVSVLGPTYALNGPKGSMHSSVKAMKEERMMILYAFGGGAIMFGCSQLSTAWIMMRSPSASVNTVIVLIAFYQITVSVRRISAKFKFHSTEMSVEGTDTQKMKGASYVMAMNHKNTVRGVDNMDQVAGDAQILAMANMKEGKV